MKIVLSIPIILSLLLVGCEGSKTSVSQQQESRQESGSSSSPESRESEVWPYMPDNLGNISIDSNVLATNYLVLLDTSGSMDKRECSGNKTKLETSKEAIAEFVDLVPESDNLSLMSFHGMRVDFGSGDTNRKNFLNAISQERSSGGTPLHSYTKESFWILTNQAQKQLGYGTYRLVVITDGASSDDDPGPLVEEIVRRSPIEIHVIGFCVGEKHSMNRPGYSTYYTADSPEQLMEGLRKVQAETSDFTQTSFDN